MTPTDLLSGLYLLTGPLLSLAYLPQILALWYDKTGAAALSLVTWGSWAVALSITAAYAAWVNHDILFFITSMCSCVGCTSIFFLACAKRYGFAKHTRHPIPPGNDR